MRRLLLLVGAVVLVDTIFFSALTPLLPHYVDELGLSKTGAGILAAAYPAGTLVGSIPSGVIAVRLGVKPAVLIGLGGLAVTTIVFGFASSEWLLVAARFVQGAASSCSWAGGFAWLVSAAPQQRRGELIGAALGAAIFGALLGPVLGGIASVVGTGPAFSGVAVLAAALAVWAITTPAFPPVGYQPLGSLFEALLDRRIMGGAWLVMLPALSFGTLNVLGPLRLDELGVGAVAISAIFLVSAGVEALLNPLVGRVSDRRGRVLPLRAGVLASTVVTLLLPWPGSRYLLAPLIVAAAMSFGTLWTPALALLSDGAEGRGLDHAYAFALVNLAWSPGAALGGALGGSVANATADAVPYLALAALFLATLPFLRSRALSVAPV
jgi:MFS family permease